MWQCVSLWCFWEPLNIRRLQILLILVCLLSWQDLLWLGIAYELYKQACIDYADLLVGEDHHPKQKVWYVQIRICSFSDYKLMCVCTWLQVRICCCLHWPVHWTILSGVCQYSQLLQRNAMSNLEKICLVNIFRYQVFCLYVSWSATLKASVKRLLLWIYHSHSPLSNSQGQKL